MCTRYYLSPSSPELKKIIEAVKLSPLSKRFAINLSSPVKTAGEIRPTDVVPVLAPNSRGEQTVFPMKWGYTNPHKGGKLLLNARSETASQKPTFVILTREPGKEIEKIHDRMPLILPSSLIGDWIRLGSDPKEVMRGALTEMYAEKG